jgi:hypothetical protein
MSVGFDPSTDFETITDGLEPVTLNRRGSSANVSIAKALQRAVTTGEVEASNGQYTQGDVRWHLPKAEVTDTPKIGDSIVDAGGTYWAILTVQEATLSARWRCVSRDVVIQYGLDDTLTIEVATYVKGDGGAAERTWSTFKTARGRIQELTSDVEDREGARRMATQFDIFIMTDIDFDQNHRIKGVDGKLYNVTGNTGVGDISALQVVQATEWRQV